MFPTQPTRVVRSSKIASVRDAIRPVIFLVFMFDFFHRTVKNSLRVFGMCTVFSDFLHGAAKSLCLILVSFQSILLGVKIFRHRSHLVSAIAKSALGYGIVARCAKRLTAKNAHCRKQKPYKKSALLKCLDCIRGAGWCKTAGGSALEGREIFLVKTNKPDTQVLHGVLFSRNISSFKKPRRSSLSTSVDLISRIPSRGAMTIKNPVLSSGSTAR